jgi:hypothetical protein
MRTRSALGIVDSYGRVDDRILEACREIYTRILSSGVLARTDQDLLDSANGSALVEDKISMTKRLQIVVFAIRRDVLQPCSTQDYKEYQDQYHSTMFLHRSHVYQDVPGLTEITIQADLFRTAFSQQVVHITICIDSHVLDRTSKVLAACLIKSTPKAVGGRSMIPASESAELYATLFAATAGKGVNRQRLKQSEQSIPMQILYRIRSEWNIRTNFNHLAVAALETSLGQENIPNQDDDITRYSQPENVVALLGHLQRNGDAKSDLDHLLHCSCNPYSIGTSISGDGWDSFTTLNFCIPSSTHCIKTLSSVGKNWFHDDSGGYQRDEGDSGEILHLDIFAEFTLIRKAAYEDFVAPGTRGISLPYYNTVLRTRKLQGSVVVAEGLHSHVYSR